MFKFDKGTKMPNEKIEFCVSAESVITGNIQTKNDIRVDGQVDGDINTTGNVYISFGAKVSGNVTGMDIHIDGEVKGNINAAGEFMMYTNASLSGDIKAAGIRVEKGTVYDGRLSIAMDVTIQANEISE
jgi:cytoskeletal protein CcmA (bactofilin family)